MDRTINIKELLEGISAHDTKVFSRFLNMKEAKRRFIQFFHFGMAKLRHFFKLPTPFLYLSVT